MSMFVRDTLSVSTVEFKSILVPTGCLGMRCMRVKLRRGQDVLGILSRASLSLLEKIGAEHVSRVMYPGLTTSPTSESVTQPDFCASHPATARASKAFLHCDAFFNSVSLIS